MQICERTEVEGSDQGRQSDHLYANDSRASYRDVGLHKNRCGSLRSRE